MELIMYSLIRISRVEKEVFSVRPGGMYVCSVGPHRDKGIPEIYGELLIKRK